MDFQKNLGVPVVLKGINYLLWAITIKIFLGVKGLWNHIVKTGPTLRKKPKKTSKQDTDKDGDEEEEKDGKEAEEDEEEYDTTEEEDKWFQEDQMVLGFMQTSSDPPLLEAYSYCETPKELWETLHKIFRNISYLSRVYKVKKVINELKQDDMEFSTYFGKFRDLWVELKILQPFALDPTILSERREQNKIFGLLLNLNGGYKDLVKHIIRATKLGSLEDVCSQIEREQGTHRLFNGKKELVMANKGVVASANQDFYKGDEKKSNLVCEHCKKQGHSKDKCWFLHPHLRPTRNGNSFKPKFSGPRSNIAQEESGDEGGSTNQTSEEGNNSKALVSYKAPFATTTAEECEQKRH